MKTFSEQSGAKGALSWALYDWANSAFTTLILTFVYATYFTKSVAAQSGTDASALWAFALSCSGLAVLILAPVGGAVADAVGGLKKWILFFSVLCLGGTAVLASAPPQAGPDQIFIALAGLIVAATAYELALVFYNALLPQVAAREDLGRVSSFAWAMGYVGGLISLIVMLMFFIGVGGLKPLIALPTDGAWNIRVVVPLTIVWYAVFAAPLFILVAEKETAKRPMGLVMAQSAASLRRAVSGLRADRRWRNFLIGSALYRDGLNTLFAMGGIYAAARYDLETPDILLFGIAMNIAAGLGAFAVSRIEDRTGSFRVAKIALAGLIAGGLFIPFCDSFSAFTAAALFVGLFVGPVQSASRTIVAQLSGSGQIAENYGLYALTGRTAAFLGPACYALVVQVFGGNAGMVSILFFWLAGYIFIYKLKSNDDSDQKIPQL